MIGVVVVTESPAATRVVAGLAPPMRALLVLQASGASPVCFAGEAAEAWCAVARADDRVRVDVEYATGELRGAFIAVRGDVVIDRAAVRNIAERPAVRFEGSLVLMVHTVDGDAGDALADRGDGALRDPAGLCLRVTDAASAARAEDALLDSLRKPQDGVVSRNLNRSLSLACTRRLCGTGLRPNQVSVGILAIGAAGALMAAQGTWAWMALGGVAFQAQSVLDGCDGELARLTFRGSTRGEWIDTVGDDLTNYGFFAGLSVGLWRAGLGVFPLAVGLAGVGVGMACSLIEYRYLWQIGSGDLLKYPLGFGADPDADTSNDTGVKRLLGMLRPMFKRDFFVFATMLATVAGARVSLAMLTLFSIGATLTLVAVLRSEWSRRGVAPGSERG